MHCDKMSVEANVGFNVEANGWFGRIGEWRTGP